MLCYFNQPHATGYGGDIVTLLWFYPSVCLSRFDLMNMIETKPLCAYSSNLADMFTMTKRMNPLDFGGQRSRSQLTHVEISL